MKVLPVESSHFSPEITKKIPIFLNSKCEKKLNQQLQQEKRNQTTPHSTITITKED